MILAEINFGLYLFLMEEVFTGYFESPIGWMQIQCTNEVLTRVSFLDMEPNADNCDHPIVNFTINQLSQYFNGTLKQFDLMLRPTGTEFQLKVWKQLQQIEYGKTISYLQLATKLGDKKVIRATGSANGKNPIAVIIPCHRVIGSDGKLVGYSGKIWRKKWLLEHEKAIKFHQTELKF